MDLDILKAENQYVATHVYRPLSERVVIIQALYRLGMHPQDAIDILKKTGWSDEEMLEATQVMIKSLED